MNKLSKIEFDSISSNLDLLSVSNLLLVSNLCKKDYCSVQFWKEYFEKYAEEEIFFYNFSSLEDHVRFHIFAEELVRINQRVDLRKVRMRLFNSTIFRLKLQLFHIKNIPKEIGNLVNLEVLNLRGNEIIEIPKEIGNLVNLERLLCDCNKITEIPKEIGNLVNLKEFELLLRRARGGYCTSERA